MSRSAAHRPVRRPFRRPLSSAGVGPGLGLGLVLGLWTACSPSGSSFSPGPGDDDGPLPAESCGAADLTDVRRLPACSEGSGSFGRWTLDALGLPAYDYRIDQNRDPRAAYPNSEQRDRRDHFHAFGNDRVNAIFVNDGYVQLFMQERGATWLNLFDEEAQGYGGGFSYLFDPEAPADEATWSTAYRYRPAGSRTRRRFGTGYAESELLYRGIRVQRRVFAPAGDVPGVVADVIVENTTDEPRTLRHYEYWDVGRLQLRADWLASGRLNPRLPAILRGKRAALNEYFTEAPLWDAGAKTLRITRSLSPTGTAALPGRDEVSELDAAPGDPLLVALLGPVDGAYTEQASFFGSGGPARPDAVAQDAPTAIGAPKSGGGQPHLLAMRSDLALAPGASAHLRFFYGTSPFGAAPGRLPDALSAPGPEALWQKESSARARELFYLQSPRAPWLGRELLWHSAQLLGSVGYREYFGRHVAPQGSAYLYLHGVDGAPRDLLLFALPLTYLRPQLAAEQLELVLGLIHRADGRLSYAFHGHGFLDDALIHTAPSDLYLFLLLAASEYVAATGDTGFLAEKIEAHPRGAGPALTVAEHLRRGARHLLDTVGTGDHGLLRIQTGDWSDGILLSAKDRDLAVKKGESVPNTAMAIYVLPRAAALLRPTDPALADELTMKALTLTSAARRAWAGDFYLRAYFGDGVPFGADRIHLEAQVWPLITGLPDETQRPRLLSAIAARLEARSPIGAFVIEPSPSEAAAGQAWPAVNGLLAWGYARSAPSSDRAWRALEAMTLRSHARAFPDMWAGIWSAADGSWGATGGDAPGASWSSEVTPMTDFPVMNNNAHALPLLAALRIAGIEPLLDGTGLRIAPPPIRDAAEALELDTKLLRLSLGPGVVRGSYRAVATTSRVILIEAPAGGTLTAARLDGADVPVPAGATEIRLVANVRPGQEATFEVRVTLR